MNHIEDLKNFRIDATNSSYTATSTNVLQNGGIVVGTLTAQNMKLVQHKKSVFLQCKHGIVSQCRTNCIFDELSSYEGSGITYEGSGIKGYEFSNENAMYYAEDPVEIYAEIPHIQNFDPLDKFQVPNRS